MKLYSLLFMSLIFILNSCYAQQNQKLKDGFYEPLKSQYSGDQFELKESFNGDSAYFNSYKQLFAERTQKRINCNTQSHIAFDIITNTTTYRINLFEFQLINNVSKKEKLSGEFLTKALIGFYYVEYQKRAYLLLLNKRFNKDDRIIQLLLERINQMI